MTTDLSPSTARRTAAVRHPPTSATRLVRHDSPLGRLEIRSAGGLITNLDIECDDGLPSDDLAETPSELHDEARRQLDAYFEGTLRAFDLPLGQSGTPFQMRIWRELGTIPWGSSTTYGQLAERAGCASGARAVGGAIRSNRIALLVPCHRVLGVGGSVTGYSPGAGIATKVWLLNHEGIQARLPSSAATPAAAERGPALLPPRNGTPDGAEPTTRVTPTRW